MNEEMKQSAFQFVDQNRESMLALWQELVSMESGSANKAGVDTVAARIRQELEWEGAKARAIVFETAGDILVGELGTERNAPGILLMGHMDTVFPIGTVKKRPFIIKDGMAYGPGVLDMKGGIVVLIYAIKALNAAGYETRPIKVLLAGDEEVAHDGSDAGDFMADEARGSAAAFNCETGYVDDSLVVERKGSTRVIVEVKGVAAHAGNDPENGRNAAIELAHKMLEIQRLGDPERGTLVNVTVVQGGIAANVIPDYAKAVISVRYVCPEALEEVTRKIMAIAGTSYIHGTTTTVEIKKGLAPMQKIAGTDELFALVARTAAENGFGAPKPKSVGGASDSAYSTRAGVPTICAMGVKGARNHSPDEYAIVQSLYDRTKLLIACVLNLG